MSGTTNSLFQFDPGLSTTAMTNQLSPASIYGTGQSTGDTLLYSGGPSLQQLQQFLQSQQVPAAAGAAQPQATAGAAPQQVGLPTDPLALAQLAGQMQDRNVYAPQTANGPYDPSQTGLATNMGFPSYTDPRLVQDRLAQMAQSGVPGAMDAFMRQIQGGGSGWYGGGWGGGMGGSDLAANAASDAANNEINS